MINQNESYSFCLFPKEKGVVDMAEVVVMAVLVIWASHPLAK
jgi:hypothetical protein